jgi:hypothetical protein
MHNKKQIILKKNIIDHIDLIHNHFHYPQLF